MSCPAYPASNKNRPQLIKKYQRPSIKKTVLNEQHLYLIAIPYYSQINGKVLIPSYYKPLACDVVLMFSRYIWLSKTLSNQTLAMIILDLAG
jgi:hypothetical protein